MGVNFDGENVGRGAIFFLSRLIPIEEGDIKENSKAAYSESRSIHHAGRLSFSFKGHNYLLLERLFQSYHLNPTLSGVKCWQKVLKYFSLQYLLVTINDDLHLKDA